jgi:hypothetical protein
MLADGMAKKLVILGLVLVAFLLLHNFASADVPPRRLVVDIHVTYNGEEVPDASFDAVLLSRREVEPPTFLIPELDIVVNDSARNCTYRPYVVDQCQNSECAFLDLGRNIAEGEYSHDCILAVYLPSEDRVFLSDKFYAKAYSYNVFDAILLPNGTITLQESAPEVEDAKKLFIRSLILTLLFELIIAYIFCFLAKIPKKILLSVVLANIISVSIVSITLPIVFTHLDYIYTYISYILVKVDYFLWAIGLIRIIALILFPGVAIFVFEACFIYLLNKEIITLKRSFWLSLLMNLTSYILGQLTFIEFFWGSW